jgi:hypothetical protein
MLFIGEAKMRIQMRQTAIFFRDHPDNGQKIAEGPNIDVSEEGKLQA